ncbi:hypothetical protein L9F63_028026, partial [Diploptera punctata]
FNKTTVQAQNSKKFWKIETTHSDEIPAKDDEPSFLKSDNSRWSSFATNSSSHLSYEQEEVPSRLNLSHSSPSYRNYEDDTARSRFSYLKSQDTSSSAQFISVVEGLHFTFIRSSLSGTRNDDSFLRTRNIYTDTRSEMSPRYRLPGFPEEHSARMARHIQPQPKQKGLQLIIYGATILTVVILLYILYNAWSENDPYRQIEEEAKKLIEESNHMNIK